MASYEQALEVIKSEHEIVSTLFQFIDRMNDDCDEDPLSKSAGEFIKAVAPKIEEHLKALGY
tara:strand:- start:265 stop:450 length:186 start_codon:yes stop_codon:yes gene_type:complete